MSALSSSEAQTPRLWVVSHDRIAVRDKPDLKGRLVASHKRGDDVLATRENEEWLRIGRERFALIDGAPLGFGVLLRRKDEPISLKVINPVHRPSGIDARCSWRCYDLQDDDVCMPTLQRISKTDLLSPSWVAPAGGRLAVLRPRRPDDDDDRRVSTESRRVRAFDGRAPAVAVNRAGAGQDGHSYYRLEVQRLRGRHDARGLRVG